MHMSDLISSLLVGDMATCSIVVIAVWARMYRPGANIETEEEYFAQPKIMISDNNSNMN